MRQAPSTSIWLSRKGKKMLTKKFFSKNTPYVPPPFDGTHAIFKVGTSPSFQTNKYSFSDFSAVSGGTLQSSQDASEGFSNSVVGMMIHNNTSAGDLYTFATDSSALAAAINISLGSGSGTSSTSTTGYVFANTANPVRKYDYSGNSYSNGSTLTATPNGSSACGNSTYAITSLGGAGVGSTSTNKYTYAGDGVALGSNLQANTSRGTAVGNADQGVFVMANDSASQLTNVYTYAGETTSNGGNLTAVTTQLGGAGNGAVAVFSISSINSGRSTNVYTHATNTNAVAGSLLSAAPSAAGPAAISNGISGVTGP